MLTRSALRILRSLPPKHLLHSSLLLARPASRFTRSRPRPPPRHPPAANLPAPPPSTALVTEPAPPVSSIPVTVPHDEHGVLDRARGEWSDQVRQLLAQPALVVARQLEMMNVMLGWEEANKYQLLSPEGALLGYLLEEETGVLGGTLRRQLLRTHRPFRATILSPSGDVLLRIHRPFALINSRIFISTPSEGHTTAMDAKREMESVEKGGQTQGEVIGECQQQWNLLRRQYQTFVRRGDGDSEGEMVQFGSIDSGFMAWDFSVKDESGNVIASISRNFTGFARELFADVGQYVLRFESVVDEFQQDTPQLAPPSAPGSLPAPSGSSPSSPALSPTPTSSPASLTPTSSPDPSSPSPSSTTALVPTPSRPSIPLDHRAVLLATAVSIDFDYFSRARGGGLFGGGMFMPIPIPMGGAGAEAGAEAGEVAGTAAGAEEEARAGTIGTGSAYGEGPLPPTEEGGAASGGFGAPAEGGDELLSDPWAEEGGQEEGGTWGWNDLFGNDGDEGGGGGDWGGDGDGW
ncbi:hypothetical protein JCM5296_001835 [Sporobolomyces johnsonii]